MREHGSKAASAAHQVAAALGQDAVQDDELVQPGGQRHEVALTQVARHQPPLLPLLLFLVLGGAPLLVRLAAAEVLGVPQVRGSTRKLEPRRVERSFEARDLLEEAEALHLFRHGGHAGQGRSRTRSAASAVPLDPERAMQRTTCANCACMGPDDLLTRVSTAR